MADTQTVGKREFLLHSNRYLKVVEEKKQEIIVTYRNKPVLKIVPVSKTPLDELRGLIRHIEFEEDVTEPIFEGFDKW